MAARLYAPGATEVASYDESGYQWTTLQDPEGNEFDVVRAPWRGWDSAAPSSTAIQCYYVPVVNITE